VSHDKKELDSGSWSTFNHEETALKDSGGNNYCLLFLTLKDEKFRTWCSRIHFDILPISDVGICGRIVVGNSM
jgi:hypothetical protein